MCARKQRNMAGIQNPNNNGEECVKIEDGVIIVPRTPHFYTQKLYADFTLDAYPTEQNNNRPLLMMAGPSLAMSVPMILGTLISSNQGTTNSGLLMFAASPVITMAWILYSRMTMNKKLKGQKKDYSKRLNQTIKSIEANIQERKEELAQNYPDFDMCINLIDEALNGTNHNTTNRVTLWQRLPRSYDFLHVTAGYGDYPLPFKINVPQLPMGKSVNINQSDIEGIAEEEKPFFINYIKEKYALLDNQPLAIDLKEHLAVGIVGKSNDNNRYSQEALLEVYSFVLQLVTLHSYNDLRIAVLCDEKDEENWKWMRWIPHLKRNDDQTAYMIATNKDEAVELLNHLVNIQMSYGNDEQRKDQQGRVHYVVICTQKEYLAVHPFVRNAEAFSSCFTIISVAGSVSNVIKECSLLIDVDNHMEINYTGGLVYTYKNGLYGMRENQKETNIQDQIQRIKRAIPKLAGVREIEQDVESSIPRSVTFLEVYGKRSISFDDIDKKWKNSSTTKDIKAYIGIGAGGKPFVLNLSDKADGPHGLIAGTTGSGKSVLLQTLVLSLMVEYHPSELQFILIDYKGNDTFKPFEKMPHVVGTINNIQGKGQLRRAWASIKGEIQRRQKLFDSKSAHNIDDYISRFNKKEKNADNLSHLIVIIDEFAEMASEERELVHDLDTVARVGRSLGIHLILSMQNPGTAVDDQIRSNSRFQICLRVQSAADSQQILRKPDGAFLKGKGRCYVQIGNDEAFDLVQSSWSGAKYDENAQNENDMVQMIGAQGRLIPLPASDSRGKTQTQIEKICDIVGDGTRNQLQPSTLWKAPLQSQILFDNLCQYDDYGQYPNDIWKVSGNNNGIRVPLGVLDIVSEMKYKIAELEINQNIMIVSPPLMGKTVLLQSMVYCLAQRYTPYQVQIYILSLKDRYMTCLQDLPHVADILTNQVSDKLLSRFAFSLMNEAEKRKKLLSDAKKNTIFEYNQNRSANEIIPAIVVMVDSFADWLRVFADYSDDEREFLSFISSAASQGIYFVGTAISLDEVKMRYRERFKLIMLAQKNWEAYKDAYIRWPQSMQSMPLPEERPGSGLIVDNNNAYTVQMAMPYASDVLKNLEAFSQDEWKECSGFVKKTIVCDVSESLDAEEFGEIVKTQMDGILHKKDGVAWKPFPIAVYDKDASVVDVRGYQGIPDEQGQSLALNSVLVVGKKDTRRTEYLIAMAEDAMAKGGCVIFITKNYAEINANWKNWHKDINERYKDINERKNKVLVVDLANLNIDNVTDVHNKYDKNMKKEPNAQVPICIIFANAENMSSLNVPENTEYPITTDSSEEKLASLFVELILHGYKGDARVFVEFDASATSDEGGFIKSVKKWTIGIACGKTILDGEICKNVWKINSINQRNVPDGVGYLVRKKGRIAEVSQVLLPVWLGGA